MGDLLCALEWGWSGAWYWNARIRTSGIEQPGTGRMEQCGRQRGQRK